jgi:hypothetical protein
MVFDGRSWLTWEQWRKRQVDRIFREGKYGAPKQEDKPIPAERPVFGQRKR